ncbi:hypothetical protein F3Y22_tig00113721pilonHSYRG00141 [Hibiscus syriacus]|uniref:EF-hand domain-containing protein n=1 Tax=Hibiscus syriacus TaxID=106335 RepID=A0A6A2X162_HIBSY|nr:hypothetical protein F3Y22_tig00113721pilonHSYRG00141 [Hibiscus syriacus]
MRDGSLPTRGRRWASDTVPANTTLSSTTSPGSEYLSAEEFVEVTIDLQDDDTIILRSVEPGTAINVDEGSDTSASASRSPTIKRSSSNRFRQFSQELKAEAVAKARKLSQELKAELRKFSCGHGHTCQTVKGFDSALAARALRKQRAQLDRTRSGASKALRGLRVDKNDDGRITEAEVKEIIMLSASAIKIEGASGRICSFDHGRVGTQKDLDILSKGAAETLKFNMALILMPVCRNTITWLRSTKLGLFVPLGDNINFHKWRAATGVLCDKKVPLKLKEKFYRMTIRPALLYGSECWAIKKDHVRRIEVAEMRMLRWTCGRTLWDMITNSTIRMSLRVVSASEKLRERRLRWFGHVLRRLPSDAVRRVESITVDGARRRGRPRQKWEDCLRSDLMD